MLCARTVPCTDRPDENHVCGMCSGEYCATHHNRPCGCDVIARHEARVHVEIARGAMANVSPNAHQETVSALEEMVNMILKQRRAQR